MTLTSKQRFSCCCFCYRLNLLITIEFIDIDSVYFSALTLCSLHNIFLLCRCHCCCRCCYFFAIVFIALSIHPLYRQWNLDPEVLFFLSNCVRSNPHNFFCFSALVLGVYAMVNDYLAYSHRLTFISTWRVHTVSLELEIPSPFCNWNATPSILFDFFFSISLHLREEVLSFFPDFFVLFFFFPVLPFWFFVHFSASNLAPSRIQNAAIVNRKCRPDQLFLLDTLHFCSIFGAGINHDNESNAPKLLPSYYCYYLLIRYTQRIPMLCFKKRRE